MFDGIRQPHRLKRRFQTLPSMAPAHLARYAGLAGDVGSGFQSPKTDL
jgi:hypothetical protein